MLPENYATIATYHVLGIEVGIVSPEQVKEWAFSVIESLDKPPEDIIEIAMSQSLPELISKLNAAAGEADMQLSGRWLLCALRKEFETAPSANWLLT